MSESVPMPESVVSAARAAAALPAAAESRGTQAPTAPAAVRGPGALTRWETVRAVMRLELLIAWRRRDTAALPVTRVDVLAARYLLLAAGWVTLFVGGTAVLLAVGGLSNDAVGRHLTYLFLFGVIAAVEPLLLAAYGGSTSLPVLAIWGLAIGFCIEMPVVFGVQIALESMPQQVVLAGGLGIIAVLCAVGLGASWRICRRIYLRQDH